MILGMTHAARRTRDEAGYIKFAWRPVRLHDGRIAWLSPYRRRHLTSDEFVHLYSRRSPWSGAYLWWRNEAIQ